MLHFIPLSCPFPLILIVTGFKYLINVVVVMRAAEDGIGCTVPDTGSNRTHSYFRRLCILHVMSRTIRVGVRRGKHLYGVDLGVIIVTRLEDKLEDGVTAATPNRTQPTTERATSSRV